MLYPNNVKKIDAVLLTHGHADAILGLDDLRSWTGVSSHNPTPVYLSEETMSVVSRTFPYLVDPSLATGGGAVASLEFHIINNLSLPFQLFGVFIQPLLVEHGVCPNGEVFWNLGYMFDDQIAYIADANAIPDSTFTLMISTQVKALVIDALRENPHKSHFGVHQAMQVIATIRPSVAYFTGLCHQAEHYALEKWLEEQRLHEGVVRTHVAWDGLKIVAPDWIEFTPAIEPVKLRPNGARKYDFWNETR